MLSALFVFLLLLFIWGIFNEFQNTPSPQVKSTPTEIEVSSPPKQPDIYIPKNKMPKASTKQKSKPKPVITSKESAPLPRTYLYNYDFPLDSCGDKDPGGSNVWYPVYVRNTSENLKRIKLSYCRDAIVKYREESEISSIQVGSFLNRAKAKEFAELMSMWIGSGGSRKTIRI